MNTSVFRRVLKVLTYAGIYGGLLMPVMFIPVVIFPFVFSKLLFFQVLIGLTFPAYLILAWIDPAYRPPKSWLYVSILGYFAALGLSVVFSVDPLRSWWGNQERMNGLFTLLHFLAWLTMAIGTLKSWKDWRWLLNFEVGLSVFMACISVLEKPFPNLLNFPSGPRIGGLLDNPIYMGVYQIFNLFFIALLWARGASKETKTWYIVAAVLDIVAFILAQSRGALVGLGLGIVVAAVAFAIMTPHKKSKQIVLGGAGALLVLYGALFLLRNVPLVANSPFARFVSISATRTRVIAWEIAWQGFKARPLTGWGLDTFHVLFNEKYNPESLRYSYYETWFDRSHNTVMDALSMTGVLGTAAYMLIFVAIFWLLIRARRAGKLDVPTTSLLIGLPVAYFAQNLFVFDHPAAFSMSFLMYALVIAMTASGFTEEKVSHATPSIKEWMPWAFAAVEVVALILVLRTSVLPAQASILSIKSNKAFTAGNYASAYSYAKQAATISTPYLDEQTFLQSRNLITLAGSGRLQTTPNWKEWHDLVLNVTDRHLKDHPRNAHPHFIYARFAQTLMSVVPADKDIAEREFKAAMELSPKRQQLAFNYARLLADTNRTQDAAVLLKHATEWDDQVGDAHWNYGLLLFYELDKKDEGAAEIVRSQRVAYPYQLQDPREAVALAQAYDYTNDTAGLKGIVTMLPALPRGPLELYLQISYSLERRGLIAERNMILQAVASASPELKARLLSVIQGTATSVQSVFDQPVVEQSATPTTTKSGTGPRK